MHKNTTTIPIAILNDTRISDTGFRIWCLIASSDRLLNQVDLAKKLHVSASTVSRHLSPLVKGQWLYMTSLDDGSRGYIVPEKFNCNKEEK